MIRIEFSGTASEVLGEMRQFLSAQGAPAEEAKPAGKSARSGTKASSDAGTGAAGGSTTSGSGQTATNGASPSDPNPASGSAATGDASGASGATGTVAREDVAPLCTAYGSKAGPAALKEVWAEIAGPEATKFSLIPDDKLGALKARLEELLAA